MYILFLLWANEAGIVKVAWIPPEYGDAVACICEDGSTQPLRGEGQESSFILGFTSNTPQLNSLKRWLPVAELALPGDKGDQVYSVAWAPNIGR
ncbi:Uncharacterized protein TCM_008511 [Theobroma cacao]|uniref:Transducin/WD40 repeat-like superfamily protein n=1 Tax=Theobroma cacao TaxID=3641 RepID=A0A061E3Z0_THECC|nr:Uncharacterized protein TCM_008511 [Theobroma cacao]